MNKLFLLLIATLSFQVSAVTDVTSQSIEDRRFKAPSDAVGVLGPDLFGDKTDHNTGSTSFSVTDIDIPGNSSLPVRLTRSMRVSISDNFDALVPLGVGTLNSTGWEIDVPSLSGIFSIGEQSTAAGEPPYGWVADGATPLARCSSGSGRPPVPWFGGPTAIDSPTEFWSGVKVNVPGQINSDLLLAQAATQNNPTTPARWTTKEHWLISCLPTIVNDTGEGFLAAAPDGTKYTFNRMVKRGGFDRYTRLFSFWCECTNGSLNIYLYRKKYYLVATKVEDRFGNVVNYNYDANNQLTSITASDGRQISLVRNTSGVITSATAHSKTWSYAYGTNGKLSTVTQPDSRQWSYAESGRHFRGGIADSETGQTPFSGENCTNGVCEIVSDNQYSGPNSSDDASSLVITHPSGAIGTFNFRAHEFFNPFELNGNVEEDKPLNYVDSLVSKSITGAGLSAAQTWTYQYNLVSTSLTNISCQQNLCPSTRTTDVSQPDGRVLTFTFKLDGHPAGRDQLVSETTFKNAVQLSKTTYENVVADTSVGFPTFIGINPVGYNSLSSGFTIRTMPSIAQSEYDLPQKRKIIAQDGVTYTWLANSFDGFGRANDVTRSNSNGFSKTELMQYSDDTTLWVLGQLSSVADVASGQIEQAITYYPSSRLIATKSQFGQLLGTFTWNANGTLATAKDAKNNTTTLSNYKAGNPQRVDFADASFETGVFNDFGWLTSMTNARGYSSSFTYDNVGRLTGVTPPTGDTVAWAGTTLSFTPLTVAIYGVPIGGWKHSISRGNYRKETYLDALYRPLVIREFDNANVAGTQRFTTKAYDTLNREVFSAYPGVTSALTAGARTTYDALGRVIENKADSEMGVLTTTTEYLNGGQTRVTNPRGFATTISYQAFDAPDVSRPVLINSPEAITTAISRDVFGKSLLVTRSGTYNGSTLSSTRQYVYDAQQRLCKRIEPETGASLFDYDAAGNVIWSVAGSALTSTSCDRASVAAADKTQRTYDALNRPINIDVPGTTNDLSYTYFPDSTLQTLTNGNSSWAYTYNKLGLPVTETLSIDSRVKAITHTYNTLGQESSLTYPSSLVVSFAPNALAQATQASTYASGISYFANGGMSNFTYGNGIIHTLTQNARLLPLRSKDMNGATAILDDSYAYDANTNVVSISDGTAGSINNRSMSFDAADRLIQTNAPNQIWLANTLTYDALDNIRSNSLGSRTYLYQYDATSKRLSQLTLPNASIVRSIGFDAQGNMSSNGAQSYVFDKANRLQSVSGLEAYQYDGHGRRVKITRISDNKISYPIYSLEGKLVTDDDQRSNKTIDYVYLNGSLLAKRSAPIGTTTYTTSYLHTDALGSPIAESNAAKAIIRTERYTPYGEPSDNSYDQGPGFTVHSTDAATGLTYAQQRYYDPICGCFLSPDPVQTDPNTAASFNRYNYANNNPFRFTDPDGRDDLDLFQKNEPLAVTAKRFDMPGWFTVMGHAGIIPGDPEFKFRDDRLSKEKFTGPRLNTNDLVKAITKAGFNPGTDKGVFLGQCNAGSKAREVSSLLGVPVIASEGKVFTKGNNTLGPITYRAYTDETASGKPAGKATTFNVYQPNGKISGAYSSITQNADGSVWGRQASPETGSHIMKLEKIK